MHLRYVRRHILVPAPVPGSPRRKDSSLVFQSSSATRMRNQFNRPFSTSSHFSFSHETRNSVAKRRENCRTSRTIIRSRIIRGTGIAPPGRTSRYSLAFSYSINFSSLPSSRPADARSEDEPIAGQSPTRISAIEVRLASQT